MGWCCGASFVLVADIIIVHNGRLCYVGWPELPRRLGMVYCYQRECALYLAPLPEFKVG